MDGFGYIVTFIPIPSLNKEDFVSGLVGPAYQPEVC